MYVLRFAPGRARVANVLFACAYVQSVGWAYILLYQQASVGCCVHDVLCVVSEAALCQVLVNDGALQWSPVVIVIALLLFRRSFNRGTMWGCSQLTDRGAHMFFLSRTDEGTHCLRHIVHRKVLLPFHHTLDLLAMFSTTRRIVVLCNVTICAANAAEVPRHNGATRYHSVPHPSAPYAPTAPTCRSPTQIRIRRSLCCPCPPT